MTKIYTGQKKGERQERKYLDEKDAPPVNPEVLRLLVSRQLHGEAAKKILKLVASFESWNSAYREMIIKEMQKPGSAGRR